MQQNEGEQIILGELSLTKVFFSHISMWIWFYFKYSHDLKKQCHFILQELFAYFVAYQLFLYTLQLFSNPTTNPMAKQQKGETLQLLELSHKIVYVQHHLLFTVRHKHITIYTTGQKSGIIKVKCFWKKSFLMVKAAFILC